MTAIKGIWTNGGIVLDQPADWPEGCRVFIEPAPEEGPIGIREEDWSDTPEAVAEWLQWYDSLEPLEMSAEEEADLAAWREQVRQSTTASMDRRTAGLFE
jgi:hypothetical protein